MGKIKVQDKSWKIHKSNEKSKMEIKKDTVMLIACNKWDRLCLSYDMDFFYSLITFVFLHKNAHARSFWGS